MTVKLLVKGVWQPRISPRLPRLRSTGTRKTVICRDEEGERRDSNPRPPGPQPAPTGTSEAYTALSGDPSCSVALTCSRNCPRGCPRAYVRIERTDPQPATARPGS